MMDYYGSVLQSKDQIYNDIRIHYSEHHADYIDSKLDILYEHNFINEEVSVSGWMVFVAQEVIRKIGTMLVEDLQCAKQRLRLTTCLIQNDALPLDIVEHIALFINQ